MTLCNALESELHPEIKIPNTLPEGVPPLRTFYLYLSSSCNLRCRHCWVTPEYSDGQPNRDKCIDLAALKEAVIEGKQLGLQGAKLTGGEPMLHPQFQEIVSFLSSEGLSLNMETNGTLITREMAYFLKEKSNVSSISVSIDSVIPEEHDAFRGVKGAFNSVIRGLDFLVEAGYTNCQVIMSVHRDNLNQMEKIVQLAIEHKATSVKFNPIMPTGRGINMHQQGFALDFSELLDMAKTVNEVLRPSTSIHLLFDLPPALTPLEEIWRKKGSYCHCGVNGILGILGSGEIALCGIGNTNPELTYGLLGKDSIRDIWLNNPNIIKLRKELDDYLQYPGICGSCIHAKICRTGCVAHNYMNEGILVSPQRLCQEAYRKNLFPTSRMRNIKKLGN